MLLLRLLFVLEHWGFYFRCTDHHKWKVKIFLFWIRHLQLGYVILFHVISCYFSDGIHVLISSFGISIWMVRCTKKRTYLFQLSQVNSRERRPEPKKKSAEFGLSHPSLERQKTHRVDWLGWFFRAWSGNSPCFLVNTIKVVNCSLLC